MGRGQGQLGVVAAKVGQPGRRRRIAPANVVDVSNTAAPSRGSARQSRRVRRPRASARTRASRSRGGASGSAGAAHSSAARSPSTAGSSRGSSSRGGRNGIPGRRATAAAGSSSRFVRARTARRRAVVAASARTTRRTRSSSSTPSGARTSRPAAPGRPGSLGEPLPVVADEPDRPLHDRPRAAVVRDLRSTRRRPGQRAVQAEDPPDVGQPPAVDRLVVVADEEDPVGRRGEQQGQPELGPIDVLDLVDEEVAAALAASARGRRRVRLEGCERAAGRGRRSRAPRPPQGAPRTRRTAAPNGPGSGSAATSAADTPWSTLRREIAVSRAASSAGVARGRLGAAPPPGRPAARRAARVAEDLEAEGMERPDPDGAGAHARAAPAPRPAAPPARRAARRLNVIAAMRPERPRASTSQAIRATRVVVLPLPAGAMHRTGPGGGGRGRPLIRREPAEPFVTRPDEAPSGQHASDPLIRPSPSRPGGSTGTIGA